MSVQRAAAVWVRTGYRVAFVLQTGSAVSKSCKVTSDPTMSAIAMVLVCLLHVADTITCMWTLLMPDLQTACLSCAKTKVELS